MNFEKKKWGGFYLKLLIGEKYWFSLILGIKIFIYKNFRHKFYMRKNANAHG